MTNKEAYNIITEMLEMNLLTPQEHDALQIARNLLANMLPKPPVKDVGNVITDFRCPKCSQLLAVMSNESGSFLQAQLDTCVCGQEIDWSEEYDKGQSTRNS